MNYLDYKNLQLGEIVSWEHPVTGKVYDFDVIELDLKDAYQPVRLRLLDEVDYPNIVNVSECAEFGYRGAKCWVYKSLEAHKYRDEFDEWPTSDVILLSRCYTKQYGEVIERVNKSLAAAQEEAVEKVSLPDASTGFKVFSAFNAYSGADDYSKPFMSAEKARVLAENSLNIKERVAVRIEDAAKSGEFETYLTDEEFKICLEDLVEQGYEVSNNRVSWGDQGDWGDYDA